MNTTFLLMAEFGQTDIPLAAIAERYLGLSDTQAATRAARSQLPFPAYRAGTQKAPWLVRVTDLAQYLDQARERAAGDWRNRQV